MKLKFILYYYFGQDNYTNSVFDDKNSVSIAYTCIYFIFFFGLPITVYKKQLVFFNNKKEKKILRTLRCQVQNVIALTGMLQ